MASFSEFDSPTCIHIEAVKTLIRTYDQANGIHPIFFVQGQYHFHHSMQHITHINFDNESQSDV